MKALTPRQTEVAKRVALSMPRKEIAFELGVSLKTVEHHLGEIALRIGLPYIGDVAGLTRYAIRNKMITA